ncbi:drug/metabolite transporter (DMT)-like permease [Methylopila capsulata]|uniref:Drug/metabolite transporter (DMT)-like permease n=1 Tax=Methylopila capsulata TaxID=61654 RepID=A0A9W6IXW8_9HYPH|nr:DMT family transporter [Methylopila capsulata]MBM7853466.1 drug/metabolite transporter (DMT)-like permease [Methylopila capsulata]GLK57320.1 membrane protein [Methylopila capsulata]
MRTIGDTAEIRGEPLAGAYAALLLGALAMGASPILVRLADVGPFASAFWRVATALPLLWAWSRLEQRGDAKLAGGFTKPVVLAGLFFTGDLVFWHLAIMNTTVANATFFATTSPIWVVVFSVLLLRERVAGRTLLGLALALVGGAALIGESMSVDPARLAGDLYGVVTSVFFGAYFLAVSRARRSHGSGRLIFLSSLITAPALGAIAFAFEDRLLPASLSGAAALLALGIVSHAGGQGLLAVALGRLPATFSSLVIFLEAIAAALLGWAVLGERLSAVQALGGVIILLGIYVARPRAVPVEPHP